MSVRIYIDQQDGSTLRVDSHGPDDDNVLFSVSGAEDCASLNKEQIINLIAFLCDERSARPELWRDE